MPEERIEQQFPEVLAMVLADGIHRDPGTGKFTILGTYKVIGGTSFPLVYPLILVYVEITDGRGSTALELRLIDADETREPIFSMAGQADFADNPNQIFEIVFGHPGVVFPEPGEYRLQLLGAGQLLRERRIFVLPLPGSAGPPKLEGDLP